MACVEGPHRRDKTDVAPLPKRVIREVFRRMKNEHERLRFVHTGKVLAAALGAGMRCDRPKYAPAHYIFLISQPLKVRVNRVGYGLLKPELYILTHSHVLGNVGEKSASLSLQRTLALSRADRLRCYPQ
jgi:hypothetical protein